jgi:hypothetical protein
MFAAIFMSLTYFRSKYNFLDVSEKNMHSQINQTKISLVKTIMKEKEKKAQKGKIYTLKLSIIIFIFFILILFFRFSHLEYLATHLNPDIFVISFTLSITLFFSYFLYLIMKKGELYISILNLRIHKLFYNILYLVSKKGYITGLGFLYLFSSFIFSIILEKVSHESKLFEFIELFAMVYTIIGLGTISLIMNSYYQVKSNKN